MDSRFIRIRAIKQGNVADPRDQRRGTPSAKVVDDRFPLLPVGGAHTDLDQLMVRDGGIELPHERIRDARVTDRYDRLQFMAEAAQELFL